MNVVVLIGGREAVPVRAIPLLTNWQVMSPDEIARSFAHEEDYENFHEMYAYRLENGAAVPISETWWASFPCRELKALSERISATELSHEIGYQSWRDQSQLVLPAGVFVWKDEFEMCYQKKYGPNGLTLWGTDNGVLSREQTARKLALDFIPFIPENRTAMVLAGFGPQQAENEAHAAPATGDSVAVSSAPAERVKGVKIFDKVQPYLQAVFRAGKFKTTDAYVRELKKQSGETASPFKKSSATEDAFFLKEGGKSIAHSVIADNMKYIR